MARAHTEAHFAGSAIVRDLILGFSDGLTVPFALAAGLSGAVTQSRIVVTAGLAEIVAGAISMGLGGYLAGRSELEHYSSEKARERQEVRTMPHEEEAEVRKILEQYGLGAEQLDPFVAALRKNPEAWVDFMMRFELGLEEPDKNRALQAALVIGGGYAGGGLIPLLPYMLSPVVSTGLAWSVGVTLLALFAFGFVKGKFSPAGPLPSALRTVLIGCVAAGAAFALARWLA